MDRLSLLESKFEQLATEVSSLAARVEQLELPGRPETKERLVYTADEAAPTREAPAVEPDVATWTMLVGRTLLVLGGGYLVRALTESEQVPGWLGVTLGLVYALLWLILADRAGGAGKTASATFHGIASALVAFPLLWEATVRFSQLNVFTSAVLIVLTASLLLVVAIRRDLRALAIFDLLAASSTGIAAMAGTRILAPYAVAVVVVGLVSLAALKRRGWIWATSVGSLAAHGTATIALAGALLQRGTNPGSGTVVALLVLFAGFTGHGIVRCQRPLEEPPWLLAARTLGAAVLGYGGALLITAGSRNSRLSMGLAISGIVLGLSIGLLARSSKLEGWPLELVRATVTILVALGSSVSAPRPGLVLLLLALGMSVLSLRRGTLSPSLHASALLLVGALFEGLPSSTVRSLVLPPNGLLPLFDARHLLSTGLIALVAGVCALAQPALVPPELNWPWSGALRRVSKGIAITLTAISLLVVVIAAAAWPMAETSDAGALAALRTAVLSLTSIVLAAAAGTERLGSARILVYPFLLLTAIKLLLQDFPAGRPLTLFLALLCFGGALIVAPRLLRKATGAKAVDE